MLAEGTGIYPSGEAPEVRIRISSIRCGVFYQMSVTGDEGQSALILLLWGGCWDFLQFFVPFR